MQEPRLTYNDPTVASHILDLIKRSDGDPGQLAERKVPPFDPLPVGIVVVLRAHLWEYVEAIVQDDADPIADGSWRHVRLDGLALLDAATLPRLQLADQTRLGRAAAPPLSPAGRAIDGVYAQVQRECPSAIPASPVLGQFWLHGDFLDPRSMPK